MKYKILPAFVILVMILSLPIFAGSEVTNPEDLSRKNQSTNNDLVSEKGEYVLGDTTVEVTNPSDDLTQISLNSTYRINIYR
ncbi:MAG: hypothetical protein U9O98_07975 [Asgard group archaeon]|nr:hypothetical protein [Asgard group archaeon]